MRDTKLSPFITQQRESSHFLDRRYTPSIYGYAGVAILLFLLPLFLSQATIDAMDQRTLVQLASLKQGLAYPPNDPRMMIDAEIAFGCCLSYGCSAFAFVMAVREFFIALTPRSQQQQ